ncbi:unnamed protein product [Heligmosomoides polygyrus]|uniref:Uncharacterized protein n=1 Tax=Heligmosomoides polygyrus TaxID=6339 RepID=A0A3P8FS00_HELPZ|nr:unnamed protein product [Heligmosomoides polygyrus]
METSFDDPQRERIPLHTFPHRNAQIVVVSFLIIMLKLFAIFYKSGVIAYFGSHPLGKDEPANLIFEEKELEKAPLGDAIDSLMVRWAQLLSNVSTRPPVPAPSTIDHVKEVAPSVCGKAACDVSTGFIQLCFHIIFNCILRALGAEQVVLRLILSDLNVLYDFIAL